MSFIYAITNKVNGKKYIGKTNHSIEKRFREHLSDSKKDRCKDRPLYRAINKYGESNFVLELIEEVPYCYSGEREIHWIDYYGTYSSGYNATKGADGSGYLDHDAITETYLITLNVKSTAILHSCDDKSVRTILKSRNIVLQKRPYKCKRQRKITGEKDGEIFFFESARAAGVYVASLHDNTYTYKSYSTHIVDCCKGRRKTCKGFKWKYTE